MGEEGGLGAAGSARQEWMGPGRGLPGLIPGCCLPLRGWDPSNHRNPRSMLGGCQASSDGQ